MTDIDGQHQGAPAPVTLPRSLTLLLTIAAIVVSTAGLQVLSQLLSAIFLALCLVIVVYPVRAWLLRRGAPNWVAAAAVPLSAYGILLAVGAVVAVAVVQFVDYIGNADYGDQIADLKEDVTRWLDKLGVDEPSGTLDSVDLAKWAERLASALSGVLGIVGAIGIVVMVVLFLSTDSTSFRASLERDVQTRRPHLAAALQSFAVDTRQFFVMSAVFGLGVAIADTLLLFAVGVPLALVWGALSFMSSFIPNVGFVLGLIPPVLLAFVEDGLTTALIVAIGYIVINFISDSVLKPRFIGGAVGLSATLTFVSLIFWAWAFGPLGALLAIPLTLLVRTLLVDSDPEAHWMRGLISGGTSSADPTDSAESADPTDSANPANPA